MDTKSINGARILERLSSRSIPVFREEESVRRFIYDPEYERDTSVQMMREYWFNANRTRAKLPQINQVTLAFIRNLEGIRIDTIFRQQS